jgi:hypothetical protein
LALALFRSSPPPATTSPSPTESFLKSVLAPFAPFLPASLNQPKPQHDPRLTNYHSLGLDISNLLSRLSRPDDTRNANGMVYSTTITPLQINISIQANMVVLMLCVLVMMVRMCIPVWMVFKGVRRRRREMRNVRMGRVDGVDILARAGDRDRGRGWLMGDW